MAPGDWIPGFLKRNRELMFKNLEETQMPADMQMAAWMECIEERLADLETATGTERILHKAAKEVVEDYVHRRKFGCAPSLSGVTAAVANEAARHGKITAAWDRGYANAMRTVHRWLLELLPEEV